MSLANSLSMQFAHRSQVSWQATEFATRHADEVGALPDGSPDAPPDAFRIAPPHGARKGVASGESSGVSSGLASDVTSGDAGPTFLHPLPDRKHDPHSASQSGLAGQTPLLAASEAIKILPAVILRKIAGDRALDHQDVVNMAQVCRTWSNTLRQPARGALDVRIIMDVEEGLRQRATTVAQRYAEAVAAIHPRSPHAIAQFIVNGRGAESRCVKMAENRRVLSLARFQENADVTQPVPDPLKSFPAAKVAEGLTYAAALGLEGAAWGNNMPDGGWQTLSWLVPTIAPICFGAAIIGRVQLAERTGERFFVNAMILGCGLALLKGITATRYCTLNTHDAWEPAHKVATVLMILLALFDGIICAAAARRLPRARREEEQRLQQRQERMARLDSEIAHLTHEIARLTSTYHFIEDGLQCSLTGIDRNVLQVHVTEVPVQQEPAEAEAFDIQIDNAEAQ